MLHIRVFLIGVATCNYSEPVANQSQFRGLRHQGYTVWILKLSN